MRIAVIGAGIVGVTTAFELAEDGHEVTVYERHGSIAAEGSFANGGWVSPGYSAAWSLPGGPGQALWQALGRGAAGWQGGRQIPLHGAWLWRRWRASQPAARLAHGQRLHRLAQFSQARLAALTQGLQLDYERQPGQLVLLRSERDLRQLQPALNALAEWGERHAVLDAATARLLEPALAAEAPLAAAVHLPGALAANCRQFAHQLKAEAQRRGVSFRFQHEVLALSPGPTVTVTTRPRVDRDTLIEPSRLPSASSASPVDNGPQTFDAAVVCAAMESAALLRPLGLRLPLASVQGYSITAPLSQTDTAEQTSPRLGVVDQRHQISISRMGDRLRVAGGSELGPGRQRLNDHLLAALYKVLQDWFPAAARVSRATQWRGARAMLPDGLPVLGASGAQGIFLNLGHGANGWALSCGAARLTADLVSGRPPALDLQGLGVQRLG